MLHLCYDILFYYTYSSGLWESGRAFIDSAWTLSYSQGLGNQTTLENNRHFRSDLERRWRQMFSYAFALSLTFEPDSHDYTQNIYRFIIDNLDFLIQKFDESRSLELSKSFILLLNCLVHLATKICHLIVLQRLYSWVQGEQGIIPAGWNCCSR